MFLGAICKLFSKKTIGLRHRKAKLPRTRPEVEQLEDGIHAY